VDINNSLERVLAFLPYFEDETAEKYTLSDTAVAGPYVYAGRVKEFILALHEEGFILEFDWTGWREEALRYFTERDLLETADLETVCRLFTVIVRTELVTHGVLTEMMNKGVITDLLYRVRGIQAELGDPA
jgi:hypothetical protein